MTAREAFPKKYEKKQLFFRLFLTIFKFLCLL
jgi:hypothetical protein